MGFGLGLALAAGLSPAGPVLADQVRQAPKAVLELFTSQGCSSCPPADALLKELAGRSDIIALAYHVDYWDYMGWPDTFGDQANSDRQRDYASSWGSSRIYTPQLVVNGAKGVVGSRRDEVNSAIDQDSLSVPVRLFTKGKMLVIDIPAKPGEQDAVVRLVTYRDKADVTIEGGENHGRQMAYTNVVVGHQMLGMWEAGTGTRLKLPLGEVFSDKANGAVILVQDETGGLPGRIVGAASFQQ